MAVDIPACLGYLNVIHVEECLKFKMIKMTKISEMEHSDTTILGNL